jgi:two-component system, response regulator PdtaR
MADGEIRRIVSGRVGFVPRPCMTLGAAPKRAAWLVKVMERMSSTVLNSLQFVACRCPPRGEMPTVLVVEDEVLVREVIVEQLEDEGFMVLSAKDAGQALFLLEARDDIRLIFTDIDMPGSMDGLQLAAAVRNRWPPVHIIVTTGKTNPPELPANALFIHKPYLARNVVAAIRSFDMGGNQPNESGI